MMNKNERALSHDIQMTRSQAWVLSLVCGLLGLFAAAAATRLPAYLVAADYVRAAATILFDLLVLGSLLHNGRIHLYFWQLKQ